MFFALPLADFKRPEHIHPAAAIQTRLPLGQRIRRWLRRA
ncbi:hypothetical protein HNQ50_002936 [Silvimonas terrae]|uniref:Uncharacterized protein n=1 Tax=Silvimonas terrae TaxID=300266 RepID=A0A840RFT7_9NEIS|nr:hypothetical protein [Silvimonas terrae]